MGSPRYRSRAMKVVSLLPSATEIVFALGLGDSLVGVTDECDFPPEAVTKPVVSRSALPQGRPLSAREIDEAVRGRLDAKEPLYVLDTDLLRRERPDVVLTQDLCRVCAVPSGQVQQALDKLGLPDAKVLSLDPHTLEEVIAQIDVVGKLLERPEEAATLTESLRMRVAKVKEVATRLPLLNVFCLEWSDPPFAAGHWVPEMVEAAAGVNLLSEKGGPSQVVTHRQIRDANPEAIVFMPCGYYLEEAEAGGEPPSSRTRSCRRRPRSATATCSPWTRRRTSRDRGRGSSTGWRSWRGRSIPTRTRSRRRTRSRGSARLATMAGRNLVTPDDLGQARVLPVRAPQRLRRRGGRDARAVGRGRRDVLRPETGWDRGAGAGPRHPATARSCLSRRARRPWRARRGRRSAPRHRTASGRTRPLRGRWPWPCRPGR